MGYNITEREVIARLRSLDNIDVPDDILQSTSYIPVADAYFNEKLSIDSIAESGLNANKKVLAKAAEIAYVAMIVINSAPLEKFKGALSEFKGFDVDEKKQAIKDLKDEYTRYLTLLGVSIEQFGGGTVGGDDYMNDGEDLRNIDFSDTEHDMSLWS